MAGQSFGARMAAIRAAKVTKASGGKVPSFVKQVAAPAPPLQRNASKPVLPDKVVQDIKNSPKGVVPKSVGKYTAAKNGRTIMPKVPKADQPRK